LSGLVQVFGRDMITLLYDEQIELRLLFTYKHSSIHTSVEVNGRSSMFVWCARTTEVHSHVMSLFWVSARTNEVHSGVTVLFTIYHFIPNEVHWASVHDRWAMFKCETA